MNEYDYITNAFTKKGENTNLEINNLNVSCITSKNNKFELDSEGNLTVKTLNVESISTSALLNAMYPIGSIYMSVNETDPSTIFGGQWEQVKDKFLLACGDTYQNGTTGGEATHILMKYQFIIMLLAQIQLVGTDIHLLVGGLLRAMVLLLMPVLLEPHKMMPLNMVLLQLLENILIQ